MRNLILLALGLALVSDLAGGHTSATPRAPATPGGFLGGSDDCNTATPLVGEGSFSFDLTNATTGSEGQNEALCYAVGFGVSAIGTDVWYEWDAPCTGDATLSTCTLGTTVDTKWAVYPGPGCPLDGTALDCSDDACGGGLFQSEIHWPVTIGTTYTIQLGTFPGANAGSGSFVLSVSGCTGQVSTLCFGDGTGTICPCGNSGAAGQGCANGTGQGARLDGMGSNSVSAADLKLEAVHLPPGQPGLFFQGVNFIAGGNGVVFGDGLRCCGMNVVRLEIVPADASGEAETNVDIPATGGVSAGDLRCYQFWYRDPLGSPCGTDFNLSNAVEVVWGA